MLNWEETEKLAGQPLTKEEEDRMSKSFRASGYVTCDICGKIYYDHPAYIPSGKTNNGIPWLNELCDGKLVKL